MLLFTSETAVLVCSKENVLVCVHVQAQNKCLFSCGFVSLIMFFILRKKHQLLLYFENGCTGTYLSLNKKT